VLLHGGRADALAELLDVGGDVDRLHLVHRQRAGLDDGEELPARLGVGGPGVRIADRRREEFQEPPSR
jgi:hypothetical protein